MKNEKAKAKAIAKSAEAGQSKAGLLGLLGALTVLALVLVSAGLAEAATALDTPLHNH